MEKVEDNNTLVFIVNICANKGLIKRGVKIYAAEAEKLNAQIRPDGEKKAYFRLEPDLDAATRNDII